MERSIDVARGVRAITVAALARCAAALAIISAPATARAQAPQPPQVTAYDLLVQVQAVHDASPAAAFVVSEKFILREQPGFMLYKDQQQNWKADFPGNEIIERVSTFAIADRTRFRLERVWTVPGLHQYGTSSNNALIASAVAQAERSRAIVGDGQFLWEELLNDANGALQVSRIPFTKTSAWARLLQVKSVVLKDVVLNWREAIELANQRQYDAKSIINQVARDFERRPDATVKGKPAYVLERRNLPEAKLRLSGESGTNGALCPVPAGAQGAGDAPAGAARRDQGRDAASCRAGAAARAGGAPVLHRSTKQARGQSADARFRRQAADAGDRAVD
jgi:hypothetical protein